MTAPVLHVSFAEPLPGRVGSVRNQPKAHISRRDPCFVNLDSLASLISGVSLTRREGLANVGRLIVRSVGLRCKLGLSE
jgi:hypothetical protein